MTLGPQNGSSPELRVLRPDFKRRLNSQERGEKDYILFLPIREFYQMSLWPSLYPSLEFQN